MWRAASQHVVAVRPQTGRTGAGTLVAVVVRVFGLSRVDPSVDGVCLRPMERRLVAALAIRRPAAVSVESLADALWASGQPLSVKKAIQTNVLRVRAQLGRTAIETVDSGYRLGDDVEVDIDRFERAVREAAESTGGGGVARWDAALAWCGDAPLDEFRHWAPADGRRRQLDELRQAAIEARWACALDERPAGEIVPDLEALVSSEPLRERRWSLLVTAYRRAGRRVEGLRAFERARRTLALEVGVSPGPELVEAYESLLRDDGVVAEPPARGVPRTFEFVVLSDQRLDEALAARAQGDAALAAGLFADAARHARDAGDIRRFAEAALGAAGDGWRASLDASDETVLLVEEALGHVPPGPTRLRARLLARSAVVRSHHRAASECEAAATAALAIARAIRDPAVIAAALHALSVVVWDPERRAQQWDWANELLSLASRQPHEPWRRWALPIVARLHAMDGDLAAAGRELDELADAASRSGDAGGAFAASYAGVLRASVSGDWPACRAAAATVRAAAEAALVDPAGGALLEIGMLGIVHLLSGPTRVHPLAPIEWPMPSMQLSVQAWHADCLARAGRVEHAAEALRTIDPALVGDVDHDAYWLATLSMLADAAHLAGEAPMAEAVWDCLRPITDLTILDPGLIYRGSAAHAAGVARATCGHDADARELLSIGLTRHRAHGSPWMTEQSRRALAALPAV